MTATVLILLDAMRWDYIDANTTPFLSARAREGHHIKSVTPSFGFCERAEILTGLPPKGTGYFTAIGYDPESSPYKNFRWLLSLLAIVERLVPSTIFAKALRKLIKIAVKAHPHSMKPYRIPLDILHKFSLTEDYYDHRDIRAFQSPNLLTQVENAGLTYFYDSFTALNLVSGGSDKERFNLALNAAEEGHSLYLVFNSVPDSVGHKYGGDSAEMKKALFSLDSDLRDFVTSFEERRPGTRFVVVGDHGMVDVEKTVDVGQIIEAAAAKEKLRLGTDYTYFLDSTLFRLWLHTPKAKGRFLTSVRNNNYLLDNGVFVDEDISNDYGIPFGDQRYGDLMWWTSTGVMILPDFFHRVDESVKGMHGYDPKHPNSQGSCVIFGGDQESLTTEVSQLTSINEILKQVISSQTGINL